MTQPAPHAPGPAAPLRRRRPHAAACRVDRHGPRAPRPGRSRWARASAAWSPARTAGCSGAARCASARAPSSASVVAVAISWPWPVRAVRSAADTKHTARARRASHQIAVPSTRTPSRQATACGVGARGRRFIAAHCHDAARPAISPPHRFAIRSRDAHSRRRVRRAVAFGRRRGPGRAATPASRARDRRDDLAAAPGRRSSVSPASTGSAPSSAWPRRWAPAR